MYKAIILPQAKEDVREAALWYNRRQKGLGKRFTAELTERIQLIRQNPSVYAIRYEDVRTAVLNIFPFMIHYTLNEAEKTIIIVGVFHTSLSPDRWNRDRE
ncbi:MAG: type II toxin-antitoxin system RelE/ParE family toxin [Bacteroidota bacterium]